MDTNGIDNKAYDTCEMNELDNIIEISKLNSQDNGEYGEDKEKLKEDEHINAKVKINNDLTTNISDLNTNNESILNNDHDTINDGIILKIDENLTIKSNFKLRLKKRIDNLKKQKHEPDGDGFIIEYDTVRGDEAVCAREVTRSQYSLVSSSELTPGALRAWALLPPEVKYDSDLEPFKQLYEQEHGITNTIVQNGSDTRFQRLPLVQSAPLLCNNLTLSPDKLVGKNEPGKTRDEAPDLEKHEKNSDTLDHQFPGNDERSKVTILNIVKICALVTCWIFFTVIFMMYNEKEEIVRHTLVVPGDNKSYILNVSESTLSVLVQLSGPFLSEQMENKLNASQIQASGKVSVWLEQWINQNETRRQLEDQVTHKQISSPWSLVLHTEDLDFSQGEKRSGLISLAIENSTLPYNYALRMSTTAKQTVPLTVSYSLNPLDTSTGVIYALLLLVGLYGLIIFEIINRTMAAVLVSTTSLAVLAIVGERPSLQELVSWLDMETLLLLFSMMVLVAIMAETGMFDFLAVYTFQVTRGKIWPLINLLCAITAIVSTVLDNVTTVLLMAPVTIRLCEVTNLNPVPILMAMVLYSNIGGTATPVGDPPNVIIASNKVVIQSGINFTNFTLHMSLGILLVCVQTYLQLRYWHIDVHRLRHSEPRDIQEMRHQLTTWRRAAQSLPHVSSDERVVRMRLEQKINKITKDLTKRLRESTSRACDKTVFQTTLKELKDKYKIRDKKLLIKASVATLFVISVFFLHSIPELNRISLAWTALLGVILLLILADRDDLEPILHRVEWSTLLFFAALFVLMEALSKLGLIEFIGDITESVILRVNENARLAVSLLLMLWVSGISSAFIDNIPLTTMMIRVVTTLGSKQSLGLPMAPLIWALSFGACLGGNGTLIGASANVLCAGVAEQHGYKFTFMQFFKIGFPVMIGHLIVASGYLMLCHCVFSWH